MAFTRIQIISNALTIIGKGPVNDTSSIGDIGAAIEEAYDLLYPTFLAADNWRFNVRQQALSKLVQTPLIDNWDSIYQLPSDYLALIRLDPRSDFQIYEDKVFSNANELNAEYRFLTLEANLPAYWVTYFVYALAEHVALAVALQESYAKVMEAKKDFAYSKALAVDGYSHPNQAIVDAPFISARFGSTGRRSRG